MRGRNVFDRENREMIVCKEGRGHTMKNIRNRSPYAGETVIVKGNSAKDPMSGALLSGKEFVIEDWWENVYGESWMFSDGNPAALSYAFRIGMAGGPIDNEVLYGKIDGLGYLFHVSELLLPDDALETQKERNTTQ